MKIIKQSLLLFTALAAISCSSSREKKCVDETQIKEGICTMEYLPVCGCNNKTYGNECEADNAGVTTWVKGACQ